MRVRKRMQRRHHSVKGRIVGLLSSVLTFGMAAGLYPGGYCGRFKCTGSRSDQ